VVVTGSAVAVACVLILFLALNRSAGEHRDWFMEHLILCAATQAAQAGECRDWARLRDSRDGLLEVKRDKDRAGTRCLREQMLLRRVQTDMLLDDR